MPARQGPPLTRTATTAHAPRPNDTHEDSDTGSLWETESVACAGLRQRIGLAWDEVGLSRVRTGCVVGESICWIFLHLGSVGDYVVRSAFMGFYTRGYYVLPQDT